MWQEILEAFKWMVKAFIGLFILDAVCLGIIESIKTINRKRCEKEEDDK